VGHNCIEPPNDVLCYDPRKYYQNPALVYHASLTSNLSTSRTHTPTVLPGSIFFYMSLSTTHTPTVFHISLHVPIFNSYTYSVPYFSTCSYLQLIHLQCSIFLYMFISPTHTPTVFHISLHVPPVTLSYHLSHLRYM
jgi:hypothetical protein